MINPFFHRGPIRDTNFFIGRENEMRNICGLLSQNQSVAIHGQRRFGKTSLLFQISQPSISNQYGVDANTKWIYIDGGTLDGLTEEWFYGTIVGELYKHSEQASYTEFVNTLRDFTDSSQLFVVLDEFELIAANPKFGMTLFNRLRGLTAQLPIYFITVTKEPLAQLTFAHPDTLSSPFFNIFASQRLSTFTRDEAIELLITLSGQGGNEFSEDTTEFILDLVGYHPLFLQIAGYHCFSLVVNGGLTSTSRREIKQRVRAGLVGHIQYYWNNLSAEHQYTLVASPLNNAEHRSEPIRESGLTYGGGIISKVVSTFIGEQEITGLLRRGPILLDTQRSRVGVNNQSVYLTQTEFALLRLLAESLGQILSPDEIEAALWPDEIAVDPERVRGIVKRLRASLGDAGDMIANRRGQGYFIDIN